MFFLLTLLQLAPAPVNPTPIATPADMPDWFDQVYEAIHTHQYYGLASLVLFGLLFGIKQLGKRLPATSKLGAFLKTDRGMMLTLLLTSLLGGAATAVGKGTKIDGALVWTAIKAAGGASFIFALVFKLAFPQAPVPVPQPVPADSNPLPVPAQAPLPLTPAPAAPVQMKSDGGPK